MMEDLRRKMKHLEIAKNILDAVEIFEGNLRVERFVVRRSRLCFGGVGGSNFLTQTHTNLY
jgi:hypothetical protein